MLCCTALLNRAFCSLLDCVFLYLPKSDSVLLQMLDVRSLEIVDSATDATQSSSTAHAARVVLLSSMILLLLMRPPCHSPSISVDGTVEKSVMHILN